MTDDTLIIGDCHGHFDRLTALLVQEGVLAQGEDGPDNVQGYTRIRHDCIVVQLGDLGHFGMERGVAGPGPPQIKSPTADFWCYELAAAFIDVILWGNHDRAVRSSWHEFGGYVLPPYKTYDLMMDLYDTGKLRLAYEAHGFLMTHAGLHKSFKHHNIPAQWKSDPAIFAHALNDYDQTDETEPPEVVDLVAIVNAISSVRGGSSSSGGILWRDASESLYDGYRQIFGHTAKDKVRKYQTPGGYSYCIDTGTQTNGRLNAIWLPSETIVGVQL